MLGALIGAGVALCHPLIFELVDERALPDAAAVVLFILGWVIGVPGVLFGALNIGRGLFMFAFVVLFWAVLGAFVFTRWGGGPIRDADDGTNPRG